jgi:DNA-binding transcriptional LysR family regulator
MFPGKIDLRNLQALHFLYLTQSVTKTAALIDRTQPAVSQQIRKLEREVDFAIIEHSKGKLTFTPKGAALARRVAHVINGFELLFTDAQESGGSEIKIGVTEDIFLGMLDGLADLVNAADIRLQVDCSGNLRQQFHHGELDIALLKDDQPIPSAAASWRLPLRWARLAPMPEPQQRVDLILLSSQCTYHAIARRTLASCDVPHRVRAICHSWTCISQALLHGGVTVVADTKSAEIAAPETPTGLPELPWATLNLLLSERLKTECGDWHDMTMHRLDETFSRTYERLL